MFYKNNQRNKILIAGLQFTRYVNTRAWKYWTRCGGVSVFCAHGNLNFAQASPAICGWTHGHSALIRSDTNPSFQHTLLNGYRSALLLCPISRGEDRIFVMRKGERKKERGRIRGFFTDLVLWINLEENQLLCLCGRPNNPSSALEDYQVLRETLTCTFLTCAKRVLCPQEPGFILLFSLREQTFQGVSIQMQTFYPKFFTLFKSPELPGSPLISSLLQSTRYISLQVFFFLLAYLWL